VVAEWKKIDDHETVPLWKATAANGVTVQLCDGGESSGILNAYTDAYRLLSVKAKDWCEMF
jgi:hypothetical protein